jgi:hypothetical protein
VFMLQDFDNLMEMEGWDHYFLYEHHFVWYSEMKDWLRRIGDEASLAILSDYEAHVRSRGFEFSPAGVEDFLTSTDETCFPDWRDQYCDLRASRWAKASAYLERQGLTLEGAEPGDSPGEGVT